MASVIARSIIMKQHSGAHRLSFATSIKIKSCYSSYAASPKEKSPENYTRYHEVSSENWKFVERLRPHLLVPSYPTDGNYASDWIPPSDTPPNLPYFVKRTKNFMVPVYLNFEEVRNARKITIIRHIEGDIWALEQAIKSHLENLTKKPVVSRVHEVAMHIKFRGDYVNEVKKWLMNAGF
ncbi:39S ribosomal protein L49, mitochondrial-like [Daphnia pulex]|uniref:39S ribosomal protein L49, mitochondrial-like n=1 Tax=Daphnia pulex TaxID=6669 RepID=UPI001EE15329|nr:39S ribosomal protein L49, mitochondrial-like [Daphnia pulex]